MELLAVGLNHESAPLAVRERLAFPAEQLNDSLRALADYLRQFMGPVPPEAAIVSTCNRTELYCAVPSVDDLRETLLHWLSQNRGIDPDELSKYLYILPRQDVVRHAFRVASGLDSMVLGEVQILGQMKQAARSAEQAGTLGQTLHQLFQRTFSVAKEVRSHTEIGAHSVSMASAGVKLAQRIFGDLSQRKVLMVGAGEMIQLCATYFAAHKPKQLIIANRSPNRALSLAQQFNGQTAKLEEVPALLKQSDIVISCTASTLPIIGLGSVQAACKARKHQPIFMLDLAVPRDIESEVKSLDDVFLYTVDDLSQIVKQGHEHRAAAIDKAEAIIETQVTGFMQWAESRMLVPTIREIHRRGEHIAAVELDHAKKLLAKGSDPEEVIELMAHRLSAKFLHGPTQALHKANVSERETLLKWLPELFNIKNSGS